MIKILIIEDDEEMCEELSDILTDEHYIVDVCHNGEQGVEAIKFEVYTIVLLDLKMPVMRGEEVLKYVKEKHPLIKVIVLTGSPRPKNILQQQQEEEILFMNGNANNDILKLADSVINKPFDVEKMLTKIKELAGA